MIAKSVKSVRLCDGCGKVGTSKIIHTFRGVGDSSGTWMACKKCWGIEMMWRQQKNKDLPPSKRYPVLKWRV